MVTLMSDRPFGPEPNPDIVRRLKQVDERLGLLYLPIGAGCWAITEKWGENDPRRERIKQNEVPANMDFDVLGMADPEMSADDAFAVLVKQLRARATEKGEYQKMLDNTIYYNKARTAEIKADARGFAHEMVDANQETLAGKAISRGAGFSVENGKVVGTPFTPRQGLTPSERDARKEMSDK
jgi:hypothetical protein